MTVHLWRYGVDRRNFKSLQVVKVNILYEWHRCNFSEERRVAQ